MFGAFLGDMIGAPYEFDQGDKTKDFPLFTKYSGVTDDSVMTVAVADALLEARDLEVEQDEREMRKLLRDSMQSWGHKYPHAGYGHRFKMWLNGEVTHPYNSCGNGSAMRVSAVGWLYPDLFTTRLMAARTAAVTHNHPEGIKGAEAIASAIFLARTGRSKEEIKSYLEQEFSYDMSRTCDEIRPNYHHVEICQKCIPEAVTAFLEGTDFEDVIRTTISLGGDTDTLAAIAGSIAEAYYGIPEKLIEIGKLYVPTPMLSVWERFLLARIPAVSRA